MEKRIKTTRPAEYEYISRFDNESIVTDVGIITTCNYHFHPEWEIDFVYFGLGNMLIGKEVLPFETGCLDIISGNVPHFYSSLYDKSRESRTKVLKFDYDTVIKPLENLPEFSPVIHLFTNAGNGIRFDASMDYDKDFEEIFNTSTAERILKFWQFLLKLSKKKHTNLVDLSEATLPIPQRGELIGAAIDYIGHHFREKITLEQVADSLGVSRDYFRRFFKISTNMGFADYLTGIRLAWAKKMMSNPAISIAAVAMDSGFNNLANFNRLFLAKNKMPPREYRKIILNET